MVDTEEQGRHGLLQRRPSESTAQNEKSSKDASNISRTGSKSRHEDGSRRLSKPRLTGSTQLPRSQTTPVRSVDDKSRRVSRSNSQLQEKALYQQNPMSQSSLGPDNFTATPILPTLHAKRSEHDHQIPRRKSSKRKAEDFAREREIKALSSSPIPIPKRPGAFYGSGPLQRDTKQIPGSLNRRLERPTSEVSLPQPESLPDIDDISNQNSFKVGLLAALSPRPTIRYDSNPRLTTGKQPIRHNVAIQQAIAEEDTSDSKRINELADDLDANGLRELMERDRRRREKKKESDRAKLQRRLQRRAERQREEEARRARTEAFVRESPVEQENPVELSAEPVAIVHHATTVEKTEGDETNPFFDDADGLVAPAPTLIRNPFEDEKDEDVMQDPHESDEELDLPVPERSLLRNREPDIPQPRPQISQSTLSPPTSPIHRAADRSSISQGSASLLGREITPDIPESGEFDRRASDQSSQRLSSWTTFFKRGTRRKYVPPSRGGPTPSEFSNTSRESFQRKQPPPAVVPRTFRRSDSVTPQRTMSRFREDLPELPLSPPDSRLQSPETAIVTAKAAPTTTATQVAATPEVKVLPATADASTQPVPKDVTGLYADQQRSLDLEALSPGNPAPMILSQSLASVDSEGSWLSGRPSKRISGLQPPKPTQSSLQRSMPGAFEKDDGDEIVEDEYYKRLSAGSLDRRPSQISAGRKASSTLIDLTREGQPPPTSETSALPTTDDTKDEIRRGNLGRTPTLIQQAGRAKSKEGLLREYIAGGDNTSVTDTDSDADIEEVESPGAEIRDAPLLRARSVEYKGHIRHMSAGSAKLLDIKRNSVSSDINRPKSPTITRRPEDRHQELSGSSPPGAES